MRLSPSPRVIRDFQRVRGLVMDVDGVLTDGLISYGVDDEEMKSFSLRDGHGLVLLRRAGVRLALLSGRDSKAIRRRMKELGIEDGYLGVREKLPIFQSILQKWNLFSEEILFIGDDVVDLPVMRISGLAITVPEAPWVVRREADWVTRLPGGNGAVREIADWILLGRSADISETRCNQDGDSP